MILIDIACFKKLSLTLYIYIFIIPIYSYSIDRQGSKGKDLLYPFQGFCHFSRGSSPTGLAGHHKALGSSI